MSDYIPSFDLNVLASEDDEADTGFDLNVPAPQDDDDDNVFDVDEPQDDDDNDVFDVDEPEVHHGGNASLSALVCFLAYADFAQFLNHCFFTVLDLNLPLDEFGAVNFDYLQNLAGNFFLTQSHYSF